MEHPGASTGNDHRNTRYKNPDGEKKIFNVERSSQRSLTSVVLCIIYKTRDCPTYEVRNTVPALEGTAR
jgi:hypothetical protein